MLMERMLKRLDKVEFPVEEEDLNANTMPGMSDIKLEV